MRRYIRVCFLCVARFCCNRNFINEYCQLEKFLSFFVSAPPVGKAHTPVPYMRAGLPRDTKILFIITTHPSLCESSVVPVTTLSSFLHLNVFVLLPRYPGSPCFHCLGETSFNTFDHTAPVQRGHTIAAFIFMVSKIVFLIIRGPHLLYTGLAHPMYPSWIFTLFG